MRGSARAVLEWITLAELLLERGRLRREREAGRLDHRPVPARVQAYMDASHLTYTTREAIEQTREAIRQGV